MTIEVVMETLMRDIEYDAGVCCINAREANKWHWGWGKYITETYSSLVHTQMKTKKEQMPPRNEFARSPLFYVDYSVFVVAILPHLSPVDYLV